MNLLQKQLLYIISLEYAYEIDGPFFTTAFRGNGYYLVLTVHSTYVIHYNLYLHTSPESIPVHH